MWRKDLILRIPILNFRHFLVFWQRENFTWKSLQKAHSPVYWLVPSCSHSFKCPPSPVVGGSCQRAITQKTGNHDQDESSGVKPTVDSWPWYWLVGSMRVIYLSEPLISHLKMGLMNIRFLYEFPEIIWESLHHAWHILSSFYYYWLSSLLMRPLAQECKSKAEVIGFSRGEIVRPETLGKFHRKLDLWASFPLSPIIIFNHILVEKLGNSFPFAFHFLLHSWRLTLWCRIQLKTASQHSHWR